jgi:DNA-binding IclR family transcriptional regulator
MKTASPLSVKTPRSPVAKSDDGKSPIQVIERMTTLLDALSIAPGPLALKDLAAASGLHPSTAHRILASMLPSRLIERMDGGTYRLGMRLLELGNLVKSRINLREIALPFMQKLHEDLGESVNLGVRQDDDIVYIERTSGGRSLVRVVYLVGGRAPLHLTSVGKLFLAQDTPEAIREYAERTGLPGKTAHSLTTLAALEKDLDWVRRHQTAFDNEEAEVGLRCVAAPIYDDEGRVLAGLSVSAPSDRHSPQWAQRVRRAAREVSQAVGWQAPALTPERR